VADLTDEALARLIEDADMDLHGLWHVSVSDFQSLHTALRELQARRAAERAEAVKCAEGAGDTAAFMATHDWAFIEPVIYRQARRAAHFGRLALGQREEG